MATTEFQSTTNMLQRVLDKIKEESRTTATSKLAVIVACVATAFSIIAMFVSAILAGIIYSQNTTIEQYGDDVATYRFQITLLTADLKAKGYEPVEEEE